MVNMCPVVKRSSIQMVVLKPDWKSLFMVLNVWYSNGPPSHSNYQNPLIGVLAIFSTGTCLKHVMKTTTKKNPLLLFYILTFDEGLHELLFAQVGMLKWVECLDRGTCCLVLIQRKLNNSWMAAEFFHLLSVDQMKHKYVKTVKRYICNHMSVFLHMYVTVGHGQDL